MCQIIITIIIFNTLLQNNGQEDEVKIQIGQVLQVSQVTRIPFQSRIQTHTTQ